MLKIVELPSQFSTGEATVQLVATGGRNGRTLRERTTLHGVKTASESPALDLIRSIEPQPGRTVMLIIGLGDHETYGPNRRGDTFPSEPIPGRIGPDEVLTKWFQTYDKAHVFRHHINHDPAGAIGKVIKAFWNPVMRRVEVVQYVDHEKAPDILDKLSSGTPLACSMGCRVPFDTCTCCGNRAVSRAEYCSHLRNQMGEILPDGTQVAAINPNPDFFDSSLVTRPADRTGFVLRKVADANTGRTYELWAPSRVGGADLGKIAADLRVKAAELRKLSDIEKTLSGMVGASASGTPEGTLTLVSRYADHCMPATGAGEANYEMTFTPRAPDVEEPAQLEVKVASLGGLLTYALKTAGVTATKPLLDASLAHVADVQAIFAAYPRFYGDVCKIANIRDEATKSYHETESALAPYVDISNTLGSNNTTMRPLTDKLTYTDPHGNTYATTVGLARRARNFDTVANQTRPLQIALSAVGQGNIFGNAGHSALLHRPAKELMTNEGERITTNTEMVRVASAPDRLRGQSTYVVYYDEATLGPRPVPLEMAAVDFRARDGRPAKLASDARNALWNSVRSAEVYDDLSDALGPTLDFSKVAMALGRSVLDAVV